MENLPLIIKIIKSLISYKIILIVEVIKLFTLIFYTVFLGELLNLFSKLQLTV